MQLRARPALKCAAKSAFTFVSERDAPFTLAKLIERAGVAAKIGFKVHMHTAKTIPPALSPARCGRPLLAQTNRSGARRPSPHAGQAGGHFGGALRAVISHIKVAVDLSHRVWT